LDFVVGRVYNIDETGVSTVVQSSNIVPQIGKNRLMILAPPGTLWLLNSPQSSWITDILLLKFLELARKLYQKLHRN
jgi:hypothetical protein